MNLTVKMLCECGRTIGVLADGRWDKHRRGENKAQRFHGWCPRSLQPAGDVAFLAALNEERERFSALILAIDERVEAITSALRPTLEVSRGR